jgi:hypothetical protein
MTQQAYVSSAMFWVSMLLLWALVYFFYRDYRVDFFRQKMFDLRAELFDIAVAREIAFDNRAYARLRMQMNGFIRHADRFNIPFVVMLALTLRHQEARGASLEQEWFGSVNALPDDVRTKVSELRTRMHAEVGKQILLASPLCLLTGVPIVVLIAIQLTTGQLLRATARHCYGLIGKQFRRLILNPLDVAALDFSEDVGFAGITGEYPAIHV